MHFPLVTALLAYLLGSIPFGLLLTRLAGMGDIRKLGSGNIGATNVLRTGSRGLAAATLLCDIGKGALAVFIARSVSLDLAMLAAVTAVVGHMFPVWLRFKGGKGIATTFGALLAASPLLALLLALTWIAVFLVSRISSLSALSAAVLAPFYAYWLLPPEHLVMIALLSALIVTRHRSNISRLLHGTEKPFRAPNSKGPGR